MRVATSTGFDRTTGHLNRLQAESDLLTAQISTGKRLQSPADGPADSARVSGLSRARAEHAQTLRNIDTATARLSLGDAAIEAASNLLDRAREVALSAASDTANAADRSSAAAELAQLSDGLLSNANSRDAAGGPLFAGAHAKGVAYARDAGGAVTWQGTGEPPVVPIGDGRAIAAADPGPVIFDGTGNGLSVFAAIDDLRAALADPSLSATTRRAVIDQSLSGLDQGLERIANARARFGARLAALDIERNRLSAADVELTATRGKLEDTDISAATVSLSRAQLLLQATRDTFAKVRSLSLFDSLR